MVKLLILGHSRHGKDTVAQYFSHKGLCYTSSSMYLCENYIYPLMKNTFNYSSPLDCYNDRHNHRDYWYQIICDYNKYDPSRLAKEILKTNDIYVGMRDEREVLSCINQRLFDLIIWVERNIPTESSSSFNVDKSLADIIIDNNSSLEHLKHKVYRLANTFHLHLY